MTTPFRFQLSNDATSTGKHYHVGTIHIKIAGNQLYLIEDGIEYSIKQDDIIHYQNLMFKVNTDDNLDNASHPQRIKQSLFPQLNDHHDPLAFLYQQPRHAQPNKHQLPTITTSTNQ